MTYLCSSKSFVESCGLFLNSLATLPRNHISLDNLVIRIKQLLYRTSTGQIMKTKSLKEKFKNNILVRPLYRKVSRKVEPKNLFVSVNVDSTYKLEGTDLNVKRRIVNDNNRQVVTVNTRKINNVPGVCENVQKSDKPVNPKSVFLLSDPVLQNIKMIDNAENDSFNENISKPYETDKFVQAERLVVLKNLKVPDTWLRVFPLPALPKEATCSIIFRCIICQIGLATVLILWTVIWTFIIHSFEGPYELQVSVDFEKAQNQVVIDLATELRQITPVSPKWRKAIEKRIEEERLLTIEAVGRGARARPGQFWDLPGTFLFTIYVMTALGFGAPVPHTLWGRSAAVIYAFVAVPAHIYLMVNASTCLIVNMEACCCRRKSIKQIINNQSMENQNFSRNSQLIKTSKQGNLRRKLQDIVCLPCACHCVPLAAVLYYTLGAVAFGVLRDLPTIDIFMFPLEFTTTGGLENVVGYVRILYGVYVEGAMVLLACALATLKRHSSGRVNSIAETFRLFQVERP